MYSKLKKINSIGKGVKIAIIDSGVSHHKKIDNNMIFGGKSIIYDKKQPYIYDDFNDMNGHGTAVTGILANEVPKAKLFIIKILNSNNKCNGDMLIKAIELALDMDIDIINLSLGTKNMKYKKELNELCEYAYYKKIYMVTASNNDYKPCLPYNLSKVFKVLPSILLFNNKIYYINDEFLAQGVPQMVPWLNNSYVLKGGSSFSVPHVSATIAKIIEAYGKVNYEKLLKMLKSYSIEVKNKNLVNKNNFSFIISKSKFKNKNHKLFNKIHNIVEEYLHVKLNNVFLWQQGVDIFNAYHILEIIEKELNIKLNYLEFNLYDFYNITSLTNKIELQLNS